MSTPHLVWVSLHGDGDAVTIAVPANHRGELPALLINPRGADGHPIEGMWLAGRDHVAELTTHYERYIPSL